MNVSPHCKDVSTHAESGLGLKCQRSQLACLSPTFLFSSLATPRLDKKDFFAVIPSVINSILYSMNKFMKCQVHKATALRTHSKQLVSFFWLHIFPGIEKAPPLCLSKSFPSHETKKKKTKKQNLTFFELNWTHFSSFGLQYHLCLTIYLTFNMNISVHMTKKIPSVRALQ